MGGKRVLDAVIIVIFLAVSAWVYLGFFHPDPYFTEDIYFPRIKTILHVIQIQYPLIRQGCQRNGDLGVMHRSRSQANSKPKPT